MMQIRLRAVEPEDAELMWLAENDGTCADSSDYMAPLSRRQVLDYALGYDADPFRAGQLRLIVEVCREYGEEAVAQPRRGMTGAEWEGAGIADLYDISVRDLTAWAGIYIAPQWRRRGIGRMAVEAIARLAFSRLGLYALGAKVAQSNEASLRLFSSWEDCGRLPGWRRTSKGRDAVRLFCLRREGSAAEGVAERDAVED